MEWDGEEDESLWCFLQFCGQVLQSCWIFKHQRAQLITSMSCHCNVEAKIQVWHREREKIISASLIPRGNPSILETCLQSRRWP